MDELQVLRTRAGEMAAEIERLQAEIYADNQSTRITEQDAREIEDFLVEDYKREYVGQGIEAWLRSACRTLLTKLNEVNHAR